QGIREARTARQRTEGARIGESGLQRSEQAGVAVAILQGHELGLADLQRADQSTVDALHTRNDAELHVWRAARKILDFLESGSDLRPFEGAPGQEVDHAGDGVA